MFDQGVIFSVRFSNHSDMICSVSDDRSVRVWKLPGNYGNQNGYGNHTTIPYEMTLVNILHTG